MNSVLGTMEDYVTVAEKLIKNTLMGFAVGVALSFVLPQLAYMVGSEVSLAVGEMVKPLWTGAFFAAINATNVLAAPVFDVLFGDKPADVKSPLAEKEGKNKILPTVQPEYERHMTHVAMVMEERTRQALQNINSIH